MTINFSGEPVIGIDLGTTTVCAAVFDGKKTHILASKLGQALIPSYYAISEQQHQRVYVGQAAKNQAITNPQGTVTAFKRLMGLRFDSPKAKMVAEQVSYEVVAGAGGFCAARLNGRDVSPVEMAASVLSEVKYAASELLGREVSQVLVTVPADYNEEQRQATKLAVTTAGLQLVRLLNEPTAAAFAFCANRPTENSTIAIYDLGGGTFDVTILSIRGPVLEVLHSSSDLFLGGEDFDNVIVQYLLKDLKEKHGLELQNNRSVIARLKQSAEQAKINLSSDLVTTIDLPYLHQLPDGKIINLTVSIPRAMLNRMVQPLIEKTIKACGNAITAAGKTPGQIDEVLLIGGMTRMPAVQQAVTTLFGRPPVKGIHPEEAVSMGAARHAYELMTGQNKQVLLDVLPHSLSVVAGSMAIPILNKGTTLPAKRQQSFSTTQDGQTSILLQVVQGESSDPARNSVYGVYSLQGIIPRARGETQLKVEFAVDTNGALSVSATENNTGKVLKVNLTGAPADAPVKSTV